MPRARQDHGSPRYPRTYRLNQVLREVVAEELERRAERDDELLTVTGVTVEPDLRNAVVWLASLSEAAGQRLEDDRIALQAAVARQTRLKRTPKLSFRVDPAVVAGSVVEDTIRRIRQDSPPGSGEDAGTDNTGAEVPAAEEAGAEDAGAEDAEGAAP